jgi:hypothetical protein
MIDWFGRLLPLDTMDSKHHSQVLSDKLRSKSRERIGCEEQRAIARDLTRAHDAVYGNPRVALRSTLWAGRHRAALVVVGKEGTSRVQKLRKPKNEGPLQRHNGRNWTRRIDGGHGDRLINSDVVVDRLVIGASSRALVPYTMHGHHGHRCHTAPRLRTESKRGPPQRISLSSALSSPRRQRRLDQSLKHQAQLWGCIARLSGLRWSTVV